MDLIALIAGVLAVAILFWIGRKWFALQRLLKTANALGYEVGFGDVVAMKLRMTDPGRVLGLGIKARTAGIELDLGHIEAHALAGGSPEAVVNRLIEAREEGRDTSFVELATEDLQRVSGPG